LVVLLVPSLARFGDRADQISRAPAKELSPEEINKLFNEMVPLPPLQDGR
jgi:hypothetical protein